MGRTRTALVILAGVIALYAAATHLWLGAGASLYGRDVVGHLQLVEKFYYRIIDGPASPVSPAGRLAWSLDLFHEGSLPFHHTYIWPKLVHISAALACRVWGLSLEGMIQFNLVFVAVLLFAVLGIGTRCHSPAAGLFAAVLTALYPAVYGQARKFGLDLPLTAMTALSVLLLLRTEGFSRTWDSALWGIALGLGILTKGQIVLYIAAPFAACALAGFSVRGGRLAAAGRVLLAVALALALSSIWWRGIVRDLWRAYFVTVTDYPFSWAYAYQKQPAWTARWALFHAVHGAISVSPVFALAFLAAIPAFIRARVRGRAVLALWVLAPYAVWTLSNIKRDTDYYPCLPAVALITAIGILSWRRASARRAAAAVCVVFGLAQFAALGFSSRGYALLAMPNPYDKPPEPDGYRTVFHPPFTNNYAGVVARLTHAARAAGIDSPYAGIGVVESAGSERWGEYNTAILEYYLRLSEPGGFIYRSRYTPEAFLEHSRSFAALVVIDRRNGAEPDWTGLERFFSGPRGKRALDAIGMDEGEWRGILASYRGYRVVSRQTLLPEGRGVFLCVRPPIPVSPGTEFPAVAYAASDLLTTPRAIGGRDMPRRAPEIPEYDLIFPHWLRFALVDRDLRRPGDPYFCAYECEFAAGGRYALSARCSGPAPFSPSVFLDGVPAAAAGGLPGKTGAWRTLAVFAAAPGIHRIRIEDAEDFPRIDILRCATLAAGSAPERQGAGGEGVVP